MKNKPYIFVINTGSTTTKIGFFKGSHNLFTHKITHSVDELSRLNNFTEQIQYRKKIIATFLKQKNIDKATIAIFMCRGGLLKPVSSGVYEVNNKMIDDLQNASKQHASNLAAVLGKALANQNQKVYIADPVVVDELNDIARYSGHKLFERISIFHALNQKAVARKHADSIHKSYESLNLIVVHLGGGISIGAHQKGKVIDVNQALDGEGPFSPERSGTLPAGDLLKIAFSSNYSYEEMKKMLVGKGGLVSYTGSNNVQELENNLTTENQLILEAMAYQISKTIGEMAVVLQGNIDGIILTGGVAYSKIVTDYIKNRVSFLADVFVYPGEDEIQSLAYNGLLVWKNELEVKEY